MDSERYGSTYLPYAISGHGHCVHHQPQFYGSAFKFALLDQWVVIVSGPDMIDELRRRPAEELSVLDGLLEVSAALHSYLVPTAC